MMFDWQEQGIEQLKYSLYVNNDRLIRWLELYQRHPIDSILKTVKQYAAECWTLANHIDNLENMFLDVRNVFPYRF